MKKFTTAVSALHEAEGKAQSELQKSYKEYFSAKLNKFGAKSPADLTPEQKTEFFNEIKKDWERGVGAKEAGKKDVEEHGVKESVNEAKVADIVVPANDAKDLEEECELFTKLLKKAGIDAKCKAGIGELEVYLKNKTDLNKAQLAIQKNGYTFESVNEKEIKNDSEFKEYGQAVLKKAFKDKYDEEKANKTIEGILKNAKGDYGAAVGMLTSGLSEGNKFGAAVKKAKEEGKEEFEVDGKTYKVKEHEGVNEGKLTGGVRGSYQLDNMNNGLSADSVFVSTDRFGAKNTMNIKISAYSGGSDGIDMPMPKKLAELNDKVREGFSTKDPEVIKASDAADKEKHDMLIAMQKEIFEAVAKELDALDKSVAKIVADIVKKY
jgi:hypothetical protein